MFKFSVSKKRKIINQVKKTITNFEHTIYPLLLKQPNIHKDLILIDAMATNICTYFIGVKFRGHHEKYIPSIIKTISMDTFLKTNNTVNITDCVSSFLDELGRTQEDYYIAVNKWMLQRNEGADDILDIFLERRGLFLKDEAGVGLASNFIDAELERIKTELSSFL